MNELSIGIMDPGSEAILSRYEPVIGLEVHCQLKTFSKLFCRCSTVFGALPNHNTCPVCLGHPGALPVLNEKAVDLALRLAVAIQAEIPRESIFSRKQYFYPDLPKGYQISQYDKPLSLGGRLTLAGGESISVTRIHIEEDAGKSVHSRDASYIDLNRAGTPLVEIVTEPVMHSPAIAGEFLRTLRKLVRYLGISDGNMEEGSFRCDANVSIRPRGSKALGTRCEIKNLNSFRNVEKAIRYEIVRQADLLDAKQPIMQATMQFDAASAKTQIMRLKEESIDYRYFPEPDLGALLVDEWRVKAVRQQLPELPQEKKERFVKIFHLNDTDASAMADDPDLARYFDDVCAILNFPGAPKNIANWLLGDMLKELNRRNLTFENPPVTSQAFAALLALISDGTISGKIAKIVFSEMIETGETPAVIVKSKGLMQVTERESILAAVEKALDEAKSQVNQFLGGNSKVIGFFVGLIMRQSEGKLNPTLVNELLLEALEARREKN